MTQFLVKSKPDIKVETFLSRFCSRPHQPPPVTSSRLASASTPATSPCTGWRWRTGMGCLRSRKDSDVSASSIATNKM